VLEAHKVTLVQEETRVTLEQKVQLVPKVERVKKEKPDLKDLAAALEPKETQEELDLKDQKETKAKPDLLAHKETREQLVLLDYSTSATFTP